MERQRVGCVIDMLMVTFSLPPLFCITLNPRSEGDSWKLNNVQSEKKIKCQSGSPALLGFWFTRQPWERMKKNSFPPAKTATKHLGCYSTPFKMSHLQSDIFDFYKFYDEVLQQQQNINTFFFFFSSSCLLSTRKEACLSCFLLWHWFSMALNGPVSPHNAAMVIWQLLKLMGLKPPLLHCWQTKAAIFFFKLSSFLCFFVCYLKGDLCDILRPLSQVFKMLKKEKTMRQSITLSC